MRLVSAVEDDLFNRTGVAAGANIKIKIKSLCDLHRLLNVWDGTLVVCSHDAANLAFGKPKGLFCLMNIETEFAQTRQS